jgi:hypothetical protein
MDNGQADREVVMDPMISAISIYTQPTSAAVSGTSNAAYTLLGVGITGVVTLIAVLIKYVLDTKSEARKYRRELEINSLDHKRELEKVEMQLNESRMDALRDRQRRLFASYLSGTHTIYLSVVDARRQRRSSLDDEAYRQSLRSISPIECQVALEECRLIGAGESAKPADELWHHLRSHAVPHGTELGAKEWAEWKSQYWQLRGALIEQFRVDLSN